MARSLRWLVWLTGSVCAASGLLHLMLGAAAVPGERQAGATVDSRERFYGAIFFGYGAAWIWVARQTPVPSTAVRWLAGIFGLGGVGRVMSIVALGRPHRFQEILTVIELGLPPLCFWLSTAGEDARLRAGRPSQAEAPSERVR